MVKQIIHILLLLTLGQATVVCAEVPQEYHLKGAFLFNFARFISWPERVQAKDDEIMNFCIVGPNPFEDILAPIEQKSIRGKRIKFRYMTTLDQEMSCQLAFLSGEEAKRIGEYKPLFVEDATVAVSDESGFVDRGGDIEFTQSEGKINFIINNTLMQEKAFEVSSALLELAVRID